MTKGTIEINIPINIISVIHRAVLKSNNTSKLFTNNGDGTFKDSTQLLGDIRGPKRIYKDEPFVVVDESPPSTKSTLGSNTVHITARVDQRTQTVISIATLDNLMKGASGMAIQNANIALGLEETMGLPIAGLYP